MPVTINGNGTITGVSVGGLPDGIVDTDMLAANAVTAAKRGAGAILQFKKSIKLDTVSQAVNPGGSWSYSSGLSVTLTPSSASNSIVLLGQLTVGISSHEDLGVTIDQDGSELDSTRAAADGNRSRGTSVSGRFEDSGRALTFSIAMEVSAGNTNQRSYNYRIRHGGGVQRTLYINRSGTDTNGVYYFRGASSLLAFEVAA